MTFQRNKHIFYVVVILCFLFFLSACSEDGGDDSVLSTTKVTEELNIEESTEEKEEKTEKKEKPEESKVENLLPAPENLNIRLNSDSKLKYKVSWDKNKKYKYYVVSAEGRILTEDLEVKYIKIEQELGKDESSCKFDFSEVEAQDSDGSEVKGSFVEGTEVKISVFGKTKNGEFSRESSEKIVLAEKLDTPLVSSVEIHPDKSSYLTQKEFEEGFDIKIKDSVGADKYRLALTVYAADGKTKLKTIYSAKEPKTIYFNNLKKAFTANISYRNGLTTEYAGCILKMKIKAVGEDNLDSDWSEAFDFILPNIGVNSVDMDYVVTGTPYNIEAFFSRGESDWGITELTADTLLWDKEEYISGYEVRMSARDVVNGTEILDVLGINFDKENADSFAEIYPSVVWLNGEDVFSPESTLTNIEGRLVSPKNSEGKTGYDIDGLNKIFTYDLDSREIAIIPSDGTKGNALSFRLYERLIITVEGELEEELVPEEDETEDYSEYSDETEEQDEDEPELSISDETKVKIKNISIRLVLPDGKCHDENGKLRKNVSGTYVKSFTIKSKAFADASYDDSLIVGCERSLNGIDFQKIEDKKLEEIIEKQNELYALAKEKIDSSETKVTEK